MTPEQHVEKIKDSITCKVIRRNGPLSDLSPIDYTLLTCQPDWTLNWFASKYGMATLPKEQEVRT